MKFRYILLLFQLLFLHNFVLSRLGEESAVFEIPKLDANFFLNVDSTSPTKKEDSINKKENFKLKKMDDLPTFLEHSQFTEREGICILSKFLMSQDILVRKSGGIFDQTNFDGLMNMEPISAPNSLEWNAQRARSAVKLWVC